MNFKRIHIILLVMVAMVISACSEKYPEEYYTKEDSDQEEMGNDEGHNEHYNVNPYLYVFISDPSLFSLVATRGTGAFISPDDCDTTVVGHLTDTRFLKIHNSLFHVLAFRDDEYMDFTSTTGSPLPHEDCLLDDSLNYAWGAAAVLNGDDNSQLEFLANRNDKASFVHKKFPANDTIPYRFYAYYLDDADNEVTRTVHRTRDSIYYDLTLDGARDILYGSSQWPTPDTYPSMKRMGQAERDIVTRYGYCGRSARLTIYPIINIEHICTRLRFFIYPGDERANNITIKSVYTQSRNSGRLVVASRNNSQLGMHYGNEYTPSYLREAPINISHPGNLVSEATTNRYNPNVKRVWDQKKKRMGESLLLSPEDSYELCIKYEETLKRGDGTTYTKEYLVKHQLDAPHIQYNANGTLPDGSTRYTFMPGLCYTIHVAVYGSQPFVLNANLSPWEWVDTGEIYQPE